jgi:uncharacterized protein YdcH (DUF465 family)
MNKSSMNKLIADIRELADSAEDKSTHYNELAQKYNEAADALEEALENEKDLGITEAAEVKSAKVPSKCEKSKYCNRLPHHSGRCNTSLKMKK